MYLITDINQQLSLRQPKGRKIYEMVAAMGIETRYEDGNDVRKVNQLTNFAINSIKKDRISFFYRIRNI